LGIFGHLAFLSDQNSFFFYSTNSYDSSTFSFVAILANAIKNINGLFRCQSPVVHCKGISQLTDFWPFAATANKTDAEKGDSSSFFFFFHFLSIRFQPNSQQALN
jgi:hypothetical protein